MYTWYYNAIQRRYPDDACYLEYVNMLETSSDQSMIRSSRPHL